MVINIAKFFDKALDCQKNERPDLAITLYQEILTHEPHHLPTLYNLATLLSERRDYARAEHYYELVIELEPDYVHAYYNCAICHLQQKNIARAQVLLEQAILLVPNYTAAQHMLGLLLFKQGLWQEAKKHLLLALEEDEEQAELLNHLGMACLHLGELDDAQDYLNRSIQLMPYLAEAQYHLGVIQLKRGNYQTAQQHFQNTVDRDPNHFGAWYNLGLLNKQQGFLKIADECFSKAQTLQPDSEYVAYLRAAVNHAVIPEHPPEGFVKDLFDRYAGYYDAQMHEGVHYQVPEQLYRLFEEHVVAAPRTLTLIDLGCGTGLAGELFRAQAKRLIGIDLSSYMLEQARQKNIYDDLQQADIQNAVSALAHQSIDVFIAADVLGYIGKLDDLFESIYNALKPGGYWIFSIESGDQDIALSEHVRFTYSDAYIHQLCERMGFHVIANDVIELRKGVEGRVFVTLRE